MSYYINNNFINIIIIFNAIIGAIGGFNQTSLRKLIAFSSINNLSWIIIAFKIRENLWLFYLLIYTFLIRIICFLFNILNIYYINQLYNSNIYYSIKIFILINFLSLGGLPPFIGFFPKWIIINFILTNNFLIISFILILISLIILFFYIRIIYSSFIFNYIKLKWIKILVKNNYISIINLISFFSLFSIILRTFFFL